MLQARHPMKIEREAARARFLKIDSVKSLVKAPRICVSSHPALSEAQGGPIDI